MMGAQVGTEGRAHRLGRRAGRVWRGYLRRERQVADWLVACGTPPGIATALLWTVKLVVLGLLFYVAFWLALIVVCLAVAARGASNKISDNDQEPEWRMGLSGYGLYRGETRIDPGSSDDD